MKCLGRPLTALGLLLVLVTAACEGGTPAEPSPSPTATLHFLQTTTPAPAPAPAPEATTTPTAAGESGIEGVVLAGPTCPVERIDSPCPDRSVPTTVWVYAGASETVVVAQVMTGQDGRFSQRLAPATYTLRGPCGGTMMCPPYPRITPQTVTVSVGAYTVVTVHADTGIR